MFSQKHYQAIANEIRFVRGCYWQDERYAVERVAFKLADLFSRDNPAFKREKFLAACGLPPAVASAPQA